MQCFGNPEEKCIKSVCCMWADDVRCPNFEWLAPDKFKARAKKAGKVEAMTITEPKQRRDAMKEEIKDLAQEIIKHTRLNVKELQEGLALEEAARSISILVSTYLELEKKEGE